MNEAKLDAFRFGELLLDTNDLDPVYVLLWEWRRMYDVPRDVLRRWLLAYWCFYHVGTASWVTEQWRTSPDGFWAAMEKAAGSKAYPRAHERRHFRGDNAAKSVKWLRSRGVDPLFDWFEAWPSWPLKEVTDYVQTWGGFGPWIAFKVADMLERLALVNVVFPETDLSLYDSPRWGAELMWEAEGRPSTPQGVTAWAVDRLVTHLRGRKGSARPGSGPVAKPGPVRVVGVKRDGLDPVDEAYLREFAGRLRGWAPPSYDRPVNAQEAETVLCKWKSYMGGHYRPGEDLAACRDGLLWAARCRTAQQLFKAGEAGGLWARRGLAG